MKTKKIALFTPAGLVGKRIAEEALSRGHRVKVIVTDKNDFHFKHSKLVVVSGDVHKNEDVFTFSKGNDLVIFVNELKRNHEGECFNATRSILMGIKQAGIKFLVISGYGLHFNTETQEEKEAWSIAEEEQMASIKLLRREPTISWRYFYVTNEKNNNENDMPIKDTHFTLNMPQAKGNISIDEYASTIMKEVEKNSHSIIDSPVLLNSYQ
jgi:putative NADH-flavin reductase